MFSIQPENYFNYFYYDDEDCNIHHHYKMIEQGVMGCVKYHSSKKKNNDNNNNITINDQSKYNHLILLTEKPNDLYLEKKNRNE